MDQAQQCFLQAMMSRGVLLEAETKQLYFSVSGCDSNSEDWSFESFVKSLNQQLKHLDMQIVNNRMEDSNERWYGLVNRCVDPGAKIAAQCSAAELEFFNKVMENIVTNDGVASSTVLINAASSLERKLTGSIAQSFLKKLITSKWLCEISPGFYGAGPRFILELRPFLLDIFKEDIASCVFCKEPVIKGGRCGNNSCSIKLHQFCIAQYAKGRESITCPGCCNDWKTDILDI